MKCPLLSSVDHESKDSKVTRAVDCLREECAWWDKRNHRCVRVTESYDLSYIRAFLDEIKDKMPHSGQFTR